MQVNADNLLALFVRRETGPPAFNAQALKALGMIRPKLAVRRYRSRTLRNFSRNWLAKASTPLLAAVTVFVHIICEQS